MIEISVKNKGIVLCFVINYGVCVEIVDVICDIVVGVLCGDIELEEIDELLVVDYLSIWEMFDLDFFICMVGEMCVSNFLLW